MVESWSLHSIEGFIDGANKLTIWWRANTWNVSLWWPIYAINSSSLIIHLLTCCTNTCMCLCLPLLFLFIFLLILNYKFMTRFIHFFFWMLMIKPFHSWVRNWFLSLHLWAAECQQILSPSSFSKLYILWVCVPYPLPSEMSIITLGVGQLIRESPYPRDLWCSRSRFCRLYHSLTRSMVVPVWEERRG